MVLAAFDINFQKQSNHELSFLQILSNKYILLEQSYFSYNVDTHALLDKVNAVTGKSLLYQQLSKQTIYYGLTKSKIQYQKVAILSINIGLPLKDQRSSVHYLARKQIEKWLNQCLTIKLVLFSSSQDFIILKKLFKRVMKQYLTIKKRIKAMKMLELEKEKIKKMRKK